MPTTSPRARAGTRRSPRPAPLRRASAAPVPVARPIEAPFAAVFGVLVAAEYLSLGWLLYAPGSFWDWYVVVPSVLAALSVAGAALVVLGRGRGWLVLSVVAGVLLIGLLALVLLFGALGGGAALWQALLLLIGPLGCLALALRHPVREWSGKAAARRSTGGQRSAGRAG